MKFRITSIIIIFTFFFSGCSPKFTMDSPEGFAHYDEEKHQLKYISPEGVRIKVFSVANDPYGDSGMWATAVKGHLKKQGYKAVLEKEISTPENLKGTYREYEYLFNAENHTYSITLFINKEYIFVAETGGPKKYYKKYRSKIFHSLRNFLIKE